MATRYRNISSSAQREFAERQSIPVSDAIGDLVSSMKVLIEDKVDLMRAEARDVTTRAGRHIGSIALFGTMAGLSVLPLMAFAVIGLGVLLQHNYWLSSLIVAVVMAGVGIPMTLAQIKKLKEENIELFRTKRSFQKDASALNDSVEDIKDNLAGTKEQVLSGDDNLKSRTNPQEQTSSLLH